MRQIIHTKLTDHLKWYERWHEKMSHQYWHWLSFGLIVFVCFSLILNQSATTLLEISNLSKIPLEPKVAAASTNSFDERKQDYIDYVYNSGWDPCIGLGGESLRKCLWGGDGVYGWLEGSPLEAYTALWAWLATYDRLDDYRKEVIVKFARYIGHTGAPNSSISERDWPAAWGEGIYFTGWWTDLSNLFRIRWQYPQAVESELDWIDQLFRNKVSENYSPNWSFNNQLMHMAMRYLVAEKYNDQTNLNIAKNWLYSEFDRLITSGDKELDSAAYTWTLVFSLTKIYDFTNNTEMKKRIKMTLDFILLDSIVEVSGGLLGGLPGRTRLFEYVAGRPKVYYWSYWGIPPVGAEGDVYASSYRLPELIRDIGRLDDEPDNYWHWNTENNYAENCPLGTGEAVYVTKYYNFGGCHARQWALNIASANSDYGIRIWVERLMDSTNVNLGVGDFYQDKNAMLILNASTEDRIRLNIVDTTNGRIYYDNENTGNLFDKDETESDWRFFLEGKTAVAIYFNCNAYNCPIVIETALIGTEGTGKGFYNSYDEFKTAIISNAGFAGNINNGQFTTSQGTVITKNTTPNYPFPRLQAVDYNNKYIVRWNGGIATLQRHNLQCTYNFNNWSYSGNGCAGAVAELDKGDNTWNILSDWAHWGTSEPFYRTGDGGGSDGNTTSTTRPASQIKANFNCDSNGVNIQDFGILLSHWGKTTGLNNYKHAGCSTAKSLDLSIPADNKIDSGDIAILLSCWGRPDKDACYPAGTSSPSTPSLPSTPSTPSIPVTPTPTPTPPAPPAPPTGECTDWTDCSNENCLSEDFCICGKAEGQICAGALAGVCSEDWPTNTALTWRIDTRGYEYCMAQDEGECWCACPPGQTWQQDESGHACQSGNVN